jgi:hypothetical protein
MTAEDLRVLTELGGLCHEALFALAPEDGGEGAGWSAAYHSPAYSTEYGSATRCVQA